MTIEQSAPTDRIDEAGHATMLASGRALMCVEADSAAVEMALIARRAGRPVDRVFLVELVAPAVAHLQNALGELRDCSNRFFVANAPAAADADHAQRRYLLRVPETASEALDRSVAGILAAVSRPEVDAVSWHLALAAMERMREQFGWAWFVKAHREAVIRSAKPHPVRFGSFRGEMLLHVEH